METIEVAVPERGTQYKLREPFGTLPVSPMLRVLGTCLAHGARVSLITLVDPHVRSYLKARGLTERRFPWRQDAVLRLGQGAEALNALATVAEHGQSKRLAVWLKVFDAAGNRLLVAEDANDFLWLANSLPKSAHQRLVASVGGALSQLDGVA